MDVLGGLALYWWQRLITFSASREMLITSTQTIATIKEFRTQVIQTECRTHGYSVEHMVTVWNTENQLIFDNEHSKTIYLQQNKMTCS